jgi:hypothetical protein
MKLAIDVSLAIAALLLRLRPILDDFLENA